MNHSALHSVFQTNQSNNQQSSFEAVQSGKKKKKQKMVRADPSLLGEHRPKISAECWESAGSSSYYVTPGGSVFHEGNNSYTEFNFFNQLKISSQYLLGISV